MSHSKLPFKNIEDQSLNKFIQKSKCACSHCKTEIPLNNTTIQSITEGETNYFCCNGCFGAWNIINDLGLQSFYQMTGDGSLVSSLQNSPETNENSYSIFDSDEFCKKFVSPSKEGSKAELLIEGVTCYACIWLIRRSVEKVFPDVSISINQATGCATITWDHVATKLSQLVKLIDKLGYKTLPHREGKLEEDQGELVKVGVALFIMVNVMSFALIEYLSGEDGVQTNILQYSRWISLTLATVSIAWPGRTFFMATLRSFKSMTPNIDGPILLGILSAYFFSCYNVVMASPEIYFDSITAIIALVLTGRYFQSQAIYRNRTKLASLIKPSDGYILVEKNGLYSHVLASLIQVGDKVKLLPGDMLPVTIRCSSNCAEYSLSELNGEPSWKKSYADESIPSGAVLGGQSIEGIATESGVKSYTENLAKLVNDALDKKGQFQYWSDRAAIGLFYTVLTSALIIFSLYATNDIYEAVRRGVAILLVACPCTFAIGVPLTFANAMARALNQGILFKSQSALEKLARVTNIVFDKTGTLTKGSPTVTESVWLVDQNLISSIIPILAHLDQHSNHHVPRSISYWIKNDVNLNSRLTTSEDFAFPAIEEIQGQGLFFKFNSSTYRIGNINWIRSFGINVETKLEMFQIFLTCDNALLGALELQDEIRAEAMDAVNRLRSSGNKLSILSGDTNERTKSLALKLDIGICDAIGEASPTEKAHKIREFNSCAMVGNGLNDSVAMAQSSVGIAVSNASNPAQTSADICILRANLKLIDQAVKISRACTTRMKMAFAFAAFYNLLGLCFAASGMMSPLLAAILMPISSLTVAKIATSWPNDLQET
ncbi:MAG: heavy metal translocating P-type ATPase [Proteobacteria bacterium]|nr:heavy metal translocating P-type ATPase [Pseudomonadota bacterium]